MKSTILVYFKLLIVILCITNRISSMTLKKSETVLEFFNNLFSTEGIQENSKLENQFISKSLLSYSLKEGPEQNQTMQDTNSTNTTTQEMLQEWLRISTPDFLNKNKFPPVVLPNRDRLKIQTDSNYFRINIAYDQSNKEGPKNPLDFWFRLTPNQLYYSKDKSDYNVLGSIQYTEASNDSVATRFCFNLFENESKYLICAETDEIRKKIFCQVKLNLGGALPYECSTAQKSANLDLSKLPQPTVIDDKVLQPIILIPLPGTTCNENWNYMNNGKDWSCTCKEGLEQSPIDLPDTKAAISSPVSPVFHYEEVAAKSKITTIDGELKAQEYLKIKYFKNALRIFHAEFGKIVTLDGAVYIAEEIVFHTPSEHTIDGKRYDMEMQIIHYGQTKGDISKQVVLSFLFQKTPGVYNKFIDDVDFFNLPNPTFKERDITSNLYIPKVLYSSTDENLPTMKPFSFFTYQGSITFPPCTERTIHYVASEPIPIGSAPLQMMKEALETPNMMDENTNNIIVYDQDQIANFRETQPLNGRSVFHFDHKKFCGGDVGNEFSSKGKPTSNGHYEKVSKKLFEYIYVQGSEPSGIPNSFVVDEKEAKGLPENNK